LREEHRLRVLENRVLRKIFGPKRDEVTGEWRRFHNEKLHESGDQETRWAEHVAGNGERGTTGFWSGWGRRKERGYLEDVGVNGRVVLKWVFKR
jgi:hypothetical protein